MKKQINSEIITLVYKVFLPILIISIIVYSTLSGGGYSLSVRWLEYSILASTIIYYFTVSRFIVNKVYLLKDRFQFITLNQNYELLFNQVASVKTHGGMVTLITFENSDMPEKIMFFAKLYRMFSIGKELESLVKSNKD